MKGLRIIVNGRVFDVSMLQGCFGLLKFIAKDSFVRKIVVYLC